MRRIITIVLVLVYSVFAFQTTTQSTNSFNKYLSPQNGVSLYSGTGNTTLPLSTGIPLTLSYSSNITDNARSSNAIAPTGWLGLGWQMNFGSIVSDHKGTKTPTDDDYVWISPQGVSSKLLRPHRIKYTYYECTASWSALPDFDNLVPVKIGYVDNFNINDNKKSENFGYVFETMIDLPYDGAYTFYGSIDLFVGKKQ
ncbi:MAG: hypothetical protein GX639_20175 [Fibrobacter sp.]|nr:hypothetical protein [Fibrobacter sp.]